MAFKRALVVDDSKTARQSLAKLLANHDLEVAFAESGEAALAFLKHELVDVIFMDHSMPGMDGLEAVSEIKADPRTATIPVMMYTTKEGEVYVGQARALGAVAVLPKEVQPGVLFDMLNKLGLVADRRSGKPAPAETPRRRLEDYVDDVDKAYEQRAMSVSVQTLVTRILEEQHIKLRAEILGSQRRFAEQVAAEILDGRAARAPAVPEVDTAPERAPRWLAGAAAVLTAALLAGIPYTWQLSADKAAAETELVRLNGAARSELDALTRRNDRLDAALRDRSSEALVRDRRTLDHLQWALNESPLTAFPDAPFGDAAAARLAETLRRLDAMGFRGRITLTAQLAPFCLDRDDSGQLVPAEGPLPVAACESIGHPAQDVGSPSALQSVAFANVLAEAGNLPHISVRLAVRHPQRLLDAGAIAPETAQAGDWNAEASKLNRIRIELESDSASQQVAAR